MKKLTETVVIIGPARISYANVFKPRHNDLSKKDEYSCVLLIPKTANDKMPDPATEVKELRASIKAAVESKFPGIDKTKWDNPLKDGDIETNDEGEPKFPGYFFIRAKACAEYPPLVIGPDRSPVGGGWDSGDWAKVKVSLYAWEFAAKKGVSAGLRAVQFVFHDEKFGGGGNSIDGFDEEKNGPAEIDPFADE